MALKPLDRGSCLSVPFLPPSAPLWVMISSLHTPGSGGGLHEGLDCGSHEGGLGAAEERGRSLDSGGARFAGSDMRHVIGAGVGRQEEAARPRDAGGVGQRGHESPWRDYAPSGLIDDDVASGCSEGDERELDEARGGSRYCRGGDCYRRDAHCVEVRRGEGGRGRAVCAADAGHGRGACPGEAAKRGQADGLARVSGGEAP